MKNKKIVITIVIAVLVILSVASAVAWKSLSEQAIAEEVPTHTVVLPTVSENVQVDLTSKNDNKVVVLKIRNIPSDTESVDYELTYMTAAGLPRGVLGKIKLAGERQVVRDDITLGTCSRGSCVYDVGVKSVDLSLKFNSARGQSSVFQKTYPL